MGVQARVVLYARDARTAECAAAAAFARLDDLEQVMSDYRSDSELRRLCETTDGRARPVSPELCAVLRRARDIAERTDGAFDPTVGLLSACWRRARRGNELPHPDAVAYAMERTGWRRLTVSAACTVELRPQTELDLGGIGKGFAAHEAVKVLRARGVRRCLVALAGDIALGDPPPDADGWTVSIANTGESVTLADTCISTSGDTEQFVEIKGVRYSHIIDPRTGAALTRRVQATAIDPDGATADALATALCVAGIDDAPGLLSRFPSAAALVTEGMDEGRRDHRSAEFPRTPQGPGP